MERVVGERQVRLLRLSALRPLRSPLLLWLVFLAALAVATLGAADAALRARRDHVAATVPDYPARDHRVVPDPLLGISNRPAYSYTSQDDERLLYTNNSLGFRGREITREKPAGVRRIILVGGSTVYGAFAGDDETLAVHLERLLRQELGPRIEVINAGVPAYEALREAVYTRAELLDFEPDVMVDLDGLNDVFFGTIEDWPIQVAELQLRLIRDGRFSDLVETIDRIMFPRPFGLVEHQIRSLARNARIRLLTWAGSPPVGEPHYASESSVALHAASLGFFARYAHEREVAAIAALQPLLPLDPKALSPEEEQAVLSEMGDWTPGPWAEAARQMYPRMRVEARAAVEGAGETFLDLSGAFAAERGATYAYDVAHYTGLGNRRLAEALVPAVTAALRGRPG